MLKSALKVGLLLWVSTSLYYCSAPTGDTGQATASNEESATTKPQFDFQPPAPEGGTQMGAVILGSSGFDAFRVEIDTSNNWALLEASYGVSDVYENNADEEAIKTGLQNYVQSFLDNGVDGGNIHFIVSSSAKENEKVQVIGEALKSIGYVINEVDEPMEARCALFATVPRSFRDKAFVVDVGSGNTKLSWLQNDEVKTVSTYGSKYHLDDIPDTTAYKAAVAASLDIPEANIDYAFIIGGAPFQLAKQVRQGDERYTTLSAPSAYTGIEDQKTSNGLNLYDGIRFSTKCETFLFDWHANFAIGFLLLLNEG